MYSLFLINNQFLKNIDNIFQSFTLNIRLKLMMGLNIMSYHIALNVSTYRNTSGKTK